MQPTRFVAQRLIEAPAEIVYHCLANYTDHHRPGGFLPPAFSDQHIERGGLGDGTRIRLTLTLAGRSNTLVAEITEPQPGRVLVETSAATCTVFTVEPAGNRSMVRFDTTMRASNPIAGFFTRLFAPRLLGPLYADELERLERYAQAHARSAAGQTPAHTRSAASQAPAHA